jgi:hypothetical protein
VIFGKIKKMEISNLVTCTNFEVAEIDNSQFNYNREIYLQRKAGIIVL